MNAPSGVNCQGVANVTKGIEDVCNLSLTFPSGRFASIQSSWLDPRKVRDMTIVGSEKMFLYDDLEPMEKIRVYDQRLSNHRTTIPLGSFITPIITAICMRRSSGNSNP